MARHFGRQSASEVVKQAGAFLDHIHDNKIWSAMSDPLHGRMTANDVKKGNELLKAAKEERATATAHAGDAHEPAHLTDSAESAARDWLTTQMEHVRGWIHEHADAAATAALRTSFGQNDAQATLVSDIRAYVKLAADVAKGEEDTNLRKAIRASYTNDKARHAVQKDGEHLADALEHVIGSADAAIATRVEATAHKDAAVEALSRWMFRWTRTARRTVGHEALHALGLASARHHPAHRAKHPAAAEPAPAPPQR